MNPRYELVAARAGHRCEYCRAPEAIFNFPFEVEHIVPPGRGGADDEQNWYWALRGKLDVPKERWISFPHCEGPDGTLVIAWAGYDHLQLARSISAYYVEIQERLGGRDDPRLVPLLACVVELLPWLKQWHHDIDPDYNQRMDEVYEGFVVEEAKALNMTIDDVRAWQPSKKTGKKKHRSHEGRTRDS